MWSAPSVSRSRGSRTSSLPTSLGVAWEGSPTRRARPLRSSPSSSSDRLRAWADDRSFDLEARLDDRHTLLLLTGDRKDASMHRCRVWAAPVDPTVEVRVDAHARDRRLGWRVGEARSTGQDQRRRDGANGSEALALPISQSAGIAANTESLLPYDAAAVPIVARSDRARQLYPVALYTAPAPPRASRVARGRCGSARAGTARSPARRRARSDRLRRGALLRVFAL